MMRRTSQKYFLFLIFNKRVWTQIVTILISRGVALIHCTSITRTGGLSARRRDVHSISRPGRTRPRTSTNCRHSGAHEYYDGRARDRVRNAVHATNPTGRGTMGPRPSLIGPFASRTRTSGDTGVRRRFRPSRRAPVESCADTWANGFCAGMSHARVADSRRGDHAGYSYRLVSPAGGYAFRRTRARTHKRLNHFVVRIMGRRGVF